MNFIGDCVNNEIRSGVGKNSGKEYYHIKGILISSPDCGPFSGIPFDKFVKEDVYREIYTYMSAVNSDRVFLRLGVSLVSISGQNSDVSFNLFINGLADQEYNAPVSSNNSEKGGKKS
ncbi:MAG: hypothetical protein IJ079_09230 [Lachnospiraceae bacterium]|nr:hypothetical protein [Lachnospiraceae bacterium]